MTSVISWYYVNRTQAEYKHTNGGLESSFRSKVYVGILAVHSYFLMVIDGSILITLIIYLFSAHVGSVAATVFPLEF